MTRISRHQMWMDMAEVAARRATCFRGNMGALVVAGNDIVSMGYNGPPAGAPHCFGNDCEKSETGGCLRSMHAEENAITRASEKVGQLVQCTLYTTFSPCTACAMMIIAKRCYNVYYRHPYRLRDGIDTLLIGHLFNVFRITQSGIIVNERTNAIVEN